MRGLERGGEVTESLGDLPVAWTTPHTVFGFATDEFTDRAFAVDRRDVGRFELAQFACVGREGGDYSRAKNSMIRVRAWSPLLRAAGQDPVKSTF